MNKKENVIKNKVLNIIEKINMGEIEIYNSEKESIISLIEYYSTDDYKNIFQEFSDYIKDKEKYDESVCKRHLQRKNIKSKKIIFYRVL